MILAGRGSYTFVACETEDGVRLDVAIASRECSYSRSAAARLVHAGAVVVNQKRRKPGYRLRTGDTILIRYPDSQPPPFEPQPMDIELLYEDDELIVVNKDAGLVVHPAPGHTTGTLVNGLLHRFAELRAMEGSHKRPGIVHRLDKNTTGVLAVAKTETALIHLAAQFKQRTVGKTYLALVRGNLAPDAGVIDRPIGRHPVHRKKMSTRSRSPREAKTKWKVRKRFPGMSYVEIELKTGRTHQIRVHLASIGHPVLGDPLYGRGSRRLQTGNTTDYRLNRQMLHAWRLALDHPASGERLLFEAPLPKDMLEVLNLF